MNMDQLYIEIEIKTKNDETQVYTNVPSFLALYTFRFLNSPENVRLSFVRSTLAEDSGKIQLRSASLRNELTDKAIICKEASTKYAIRDLRMPIYEKGDGNTYIAGICAVCRELISGQSCNKLRMLLGFKDSCLQAPAEASIWTRYCEVEVVKVVNELLIGNQLEQVPIEVVRFEQHMNQPVRMHNIYKQARIIAKLNENSKNIKRKDRTVIECSVPKENLRIEHRFAEGISFTVADLLLYPLFKIILQYCGNMLAQFPLISTWLNEVDMFEPNCSFILNDLFINHDVVDCKQNLNIPECEARSLYKADPKRYKPRNRIYTSQNEVDVVLSKLAHLDMKFTVNNEITYGERLVDWNQIDPLHAKSSALPQERLARKRQQLENMANAVISLAQPRERIIDFCSGTGHLAILLALQLPQCTIIIMENKPFSLAQAKKRALELNLKNCSFYQCNIDYFVGNFDIGASLHACGTATDIVLQQCQRVGARFVCCPCCYGSLQPMPHIKYPLSQCIRNVLEGKDYLYIAHTADQAHELETENCKLEKILQGRYCMSIVDTDRKLHAEEAGYEVLLTRLKPEQCTPKNHLLVGRFLGVS